MYQDEVDDWNRQVGTTTQVFTGGIDGGGDNNAAAYASDFPAIPATIKALVVSADPFFQDTKEALIVAANAWIAAAAAGVNRFVCYPSLSYANVTGTRPTSGYSILYGPDLVGAYYTLGQLAAAAIANAHLPILRAANVRQDL
jgi:hypothetical protein